jgi:hypothetical protein
VADSERIDITKYLAGIRIESGGRAETEEVSRLNQPQREMRPQAEKEAFPDYFQRQQKQRGR